MNPLPRALAAVFLAFAFSAAQAQSTAPDAVATAAAKEPDAVVTASGLVFRTLTQASGAKPAASDTVKVHYRGTLADGKEFDSSYKRGEPAQFPLSRVIPCWTEGVAMMPVGSKAKLTCPSAIAYGPRGAGGGLIPPNATLTFEVELLSIDGR